MSISPSRNGPDTQAPPGTVAYAVGDVHGCRGLLEEMLGRIGEDRKIREAERAVAVFLGDYVDRGLDSQGAVETVRSWNPCGIEKVCLKGNHEEMMAAALADPEDERAVALWMLNGGRKTLSSYDAGSCRELGERLPPTHRGFLAGLRSHHREGGYLFVHAGIRPGVPLERQEPRDLVWIREPFLSHRGDYGFCVVHGHTPTYAPECRENRIGIDTGAVFTGVLTALALEGAERRFLQV